MFVAFKSRIVIPRKLPVLFHNINIKRFRDFDSNAWKRWTPVSYCKQGYPILSWKLKISCLLIPSSKWYGRYSGFENPASLPWQVQELAEAPTWAWAKQRLKLGIDCMPTWVY